MAAYSYVATIPVRVNDKEGKALIGGSWPVSFISADFARGKEIKFLNEPSVYTDLVHHTTVTTIGKVFVKISTGGSEITLCLFVAELAADVLLGADALSRLTTTVQVGIGEYTLTIPTSNIVTRRNYFVNAPTL